METYLLFASNLVRPRRQLISMYVERWTSIELEITYENYKSNKNKRVLIVYFEAKFTRY